MAKMHNRGHISDFEKKTILALHQDYYPSKMARIFNVSEATIRDQIEDPRLPSQRKNRVIVNEQSILRDKIINEVIMPALEETDWKIKSTKLHERVQAKFPNSVGHRTVLKWVSRIRRKHNRRNYKITSKRRPRKADKRLAEEVRSVINQLSSYFNVEMISKYTGLPETDIIKILANTELLTRSGKPTKVKRNLIEPMKKGRKDPKAIGIQSASFSKLKEELEIASELPKPEATVQVPSTITKVEPEILAKVRAETIIPAMLDRNWSMSPQEVFDIVSSKHPKITDFSAIELEVQLVKLAYELVDQKMAQTQVAQ